MLNILTYKNHLNQTHLDGVNPPVNLPVQEHQHLWKQYC